MAVHDYTLATMETRIEGPLLEDCFNLSDNARHFIALQSFALSFW
jgi:hypothetical protein